MSGAIFCPYRGCGTAASEDAEVRAIQDAFETVFIVCSGCAKAYAVRAFAVVEFETETLEDDSN